MKENAIKSIFITVDEQQICVPCADYSEICYFNQSSAVVDKAIGFVLVHGPVLIY
mgnify:CR=1 FL=1